MRDPYSVLGLAANATPDEVKAAFRRLAMQHHPDQNGGSEESAARFKEIKEAYDELTNPRAQQQQQQQGFDFQDVFQHDLFRAFRQHQEEVMRRAANADILAQVGVTLEDVFKGATAEVRVGNGHTYSVHIPRGILAGQRLRVHGGGLQRDLRYPAGDLYVEVSVEPHTKFRRISDTTLMMDVEIDSLAAVVGGEVEIDMIDGEKIIVPYGPGTQYGERVLVHGRGLPSLSNDLAVGPRGDLYVAFLLVTPKTLTARHAKLVDEIRKILPAENPPT